MTAHPSLPARAAAAWERFWFGPETPLNLAVCRVIYCLGTLLIVWPMFSERWIRSWITRPEEFFFPTSVFKYLPVASVSTLIGTALILKLALLAAAFGLMTRLSMAVAAATMFYVVGLSNCFGKVVFVLTIPVIVLGLMTLAPSGDVLSVDVLIRRAWKRWPFGRAAPPAADRYRWPLQLLRLYVVLCIFMSGLTKLLNSGLAWALSDHLANVLAAGAVAGQQPCVLSNPFSPAVNAWVAGHPTLTQVLALIALLTELAAPVALLCRGWVKAIYLVMLLGMGAMIKYTLGVWVEYTILCIALFIPWDRAAGWIRRRFRPAVA